MPLRQKKIAILLLLVGLVASSMIGVRLQHHVEWARAAALIAATTGVVLGLLLLGAIENLVHTVQAAARARAEADASVKRESWFRSLAECVDVGIFVLDEQYRTVYGNSRVEELTGVSFDDMPGPMSNAIFPPDLRAERDALLWRLDRGEYAGAGEVTIQRPDGARRRMHVQWAPLEASTGRGRTIVTLTDVTDSHRARERIRQLGRRVRRLRDEQAAKLAHRLHEGVAQDVYAAKLLLGKVARPDEATATALRAVDGLLAKTLQELRVVAHELRPAGLVHLRLGELIREHASSFAEANGIRVDVEIDDEHAHLGVDAKWMLLRAVREALQNVGTHAQAKTVEIVGMEDAGGFLLAVIDDGRGITPEQQADPSGLGLVGMAERAAELGGTVKVERGNPTGTRVSLWLPAPTLRAVV